MKIDSKRLVINNNKFFMTVLFMTDSRGRDYLKFSFGKKMRHATTYSALQSSLNVTSLDESLAIEQKSVLVGFQREISYYLESKKLEIKDEIKSGSITRTFYDVKCPSESYLFTLLVNDLDELKDMSPNKDGWLIDQNLNSSSLALTFSFADKSGQPMALEQYISDKRCCVKFPFELPNHSKLFLTVTSTDKRIQKNTVMIVPHKVTKRS